MKVLISTVLCCALIAQAQNNHETGKIIGGQEAASGQFPFVVSLQIGAVVGRVHFCGGVLITPTVILTAAHCLLNYQPQNILAYVGSNVLNGNGTYIRGQRFIVHENYNLNFDYNDDIALVQLAEPASLGAYVNTINLPQGGLPSENTTAVVLGWGNTALPDKFPDVLNYTPIGVVGETKCKKAWPHRQIYPSQLCAGGEAGIGVCYQDSGSPLVLNDSIVGIVSLAIPCAKGIPDIFTAVAPYQEWIKTNVDAL